MSRIQPSGIPAHRRVTASLERIPGPDGIITMTMYVDEQERGRRQALAEVRRQVEARGLLVDGVQSQLTAEGWDFHVWTRARSA